jgi:outer membrane protein OmpA-like peptidoglycan-associated protein
MDMTCWKTVRLVRVTVSMARAAFLLLCVACGASSPAAPHPSDGLERASKVSEGPIDRDGDGVPDVCDWCPGAPGIDRVEHPYGRGCPYTDSFHTEVDDFVQLTVIFPRDATTLGQSVDRIVAAMNALPHNKFFVIGHAAPGEHDVDAIAVRRAQVVIEALVAAGIGRERLIEQSAGASHPSDVGGRAEFDVDYDRGRSRAWDVSSRSTYSVPLGELPTCPVSRQLPRRASNGTP